MSAIDNVIMRLDTLDSLFEAMDMALTTANNGSKEIRMAINMLYILLEQLDKAREAAEAANTETVEMEAEIERLKAER